jgi:Ulp1 family protease
VADAAEDRASNKPRPAEPSERTTRIKLRLGDPTKKQSKQEGPVELSDDDSDVEEVIRQPARATKKDDIPKDTVILTYPWDSTGGVTITHGDMDRLAEGEFLNDTLLEFGLKRIIHRFRDNPATKELADSIYLFNSFFFKKLTQKPPKDP